MKMSLTLDRVGTAFSLSDKNYRTSLAHIMGAKAVSLMDDNELRSFLSPKPEDYVLIPMRALSATAVRSDTINFGHKDGAALKKAVPMFDSLVILKDHNNRVDNWAGRTQDSYWDESTVGAPPGVNFMLKIDTKKDPELARGLISGALDSGSVTVEFDYDQSHPKMKEFDFMMALGTVVDGKPVQALVTDITRLYEYSVVWQGADKYAKTITPEGIKTPGHASNSLTLENTLNKKLMALLKLSETATEAEIEAAVLAYETSLTTSTTTLATVTAEKTTLSAQIATLTAEKTTADTALTAKTTEVATLTASVTTLTTEKSALSGEIVTLKADAAKFAAHLDSRRAEALRLYNLAEADKAAAPIQATLKTAALDVAESFITTFGAKVDATMPLACTKCNSTEVSRRVSKPSDSGVDDGKSAGKASDRLKASVTSIHG